MVADAITRYRLYDDVKDPDLVQAIKYSAGMLYAGDRHLPSSNMVYSSRLTTLLSFRRDGSFYRFLVWDHGVT